MGLFSSTYKTYVGTSVSRFTDAKEFISSKIKGLINAEVNNQDVTDNVLESLISSAGFNARKAFKYGGNGYVFGRPNDTVFARNSSNAVAGLAIENYLTSLGALNVYYTKFGVNNYFHKLYKLLHIEQNFNFVTGELPLLTAEKGFTVTLDSIALLVNPDNNLEDADSFASIDFYPTEVKNSTAVTRIGAEITYSWTEETTVLGLPVFIDYTETEIVDGAFQFTYTELTKTMFMAAYEDASNNLQFFDYELYAGNAALDNSFTTGYSAPGDYLPRLYFRWNNEASNINKESIEYKHGKKLAKKIGINYDDVIDAVHIIDGDRTQEDLDSVKSVFLQYAVPADATDQIELMYLYKHFEHWYGVIDGEITTESLEDFNANYTLADNNEHVLVIEDTRFKLTIGMLGIWKRTVTGSIGAVGTYGSDKGELLIETGTSWSGGSGAGGGEVTTYRQTTWHVYRCQTTETTYIEYQVVGLETKYFILDDHQSASGYTEDVEDPKDILYVPVNYTIVRDLPMFVQEELMYKSMQIIANSVQVVKVKWYQRSGWTTFFKIAAIVALVMGFQEGAKFFAELIALASVSAYYAWVYFYSAVLSLIEAYIVTQLFVEVLGEDVAMLAAIVMTIYGASKGLGFNMPYATDMLAYGSQLFTTINQNIVDQYNDLLAEYNTFVQESTKEIDEIKAALELYDNPKQKYGKILLGQTPTEFLNKVHEGNIGARVFDLIPNYVKLSLDLSLRPTYTEV